MNIRTALIASMLVAAGLASGAAHATLEGRNLDGNLATFEAYYDTVLDITWLADANYALTSGYDADGLMDWSQATNWAANLSFYDPVTHQTYADWRLPTVEPVNGVSFNYSSSLDGSTDYGSNITSPQSELAYMYYVNLGNRSNFTPAGTGSGCWVSSSDTCLDNVGPFSNLQPDAYWSESDYSLYDPDIAWSFFMDSGAQFAHFKGYDGFYAWAVSPGDVATVPEAQTYALLLAGLGLVGWHARRRG